MTLSTPFTCPNGHSFEANAKLRARCPNCGSMARKSFSEPKPEPVVKSEPVTEPEIKETPKKTATRKVVKSAATTEVPKKSVKIIRRGRTLPEPKAISMVKKAAATTSKSGLVKHKMVRRAVVPIVTGKPKGNREHKVDPENNKPYWQQVQEAYWSR